jgi:cobalamin biosynthesis Mg chelatase CobN
MENPNRNVIPLPAGFGANPLIDERIFVGGRPLLSDEDNRILDAMLRERYEFRGVGDIRNKVRTLASFRRVLQSIDLNQGEQAQRVHGRVSQLIQALEQFRANDDNNDLAAGKKNIVRKSKRSTSKKSTSKKSTSKKSASKKSTSKKSASKKSSSKKSTSKKSASKKSRK